MAVPIQKIREIVFQMLYSYDMARASDELMIDLLSQELAISKKTVREAQQLVHQVRSHLKEIDTIIAATSHSYAFERIQSVERNILRLGVYELLFDTSIPHKVTMAEAIRLAKKFGTKESALFVHAILDAIYKSRHGEEIDRLSVEDAACQLTASEEAAREASVSSKKHTTEDASSD